MAASVLGVRLFDAMLLVTMVVGAMCTRGGKATLRLAIGLSVIASVSRVSWYLTDHPAFLYPYLVSLPLTFLTIAAHILRGLLSSDARVTTSTICASISVYLMIGLAWAVIYMLVQLAAPGSFTLGAGGAIVGDDFERLIGFSFVTLTTLGYGNVVPTTQQADAIATLEALIGQFYMAIIVARLVAMHLTKHLSDQQERSAK